MNTLIVPEEVLNLLEPGKWYRFSCYVRKDKHGLVCAVLPELQPAPVRTSRELQTAQKYFLGADD